MEIICDCGKHISKLNLLSARDSILKDVDDKDTETIRIKNYYDATCDHCGTRIDMSVLKFKKRYIKERGVDAFTKDQNKADANGEL